MYCINMQKLFLLNCNKIRAGGIAYFMTEGLQVV